MGFGQGLSGLNAASQNLDVIGNNIANSSTVGFKASTIAFADVYASSRVGLGVQVANINQRFTTGNISVSGNQFDMAIDGAKGLFRLVDNNGAVYYSRNGQFTANKNFDVVNAQGQKLTGFKANPDGTITNELTTIKVPVGNIAPQATTTVSLRTNLDSRSEEIQGVSDGYSAITNPDGTTSYRPTFDVTKPENHTHTLPMTVYDSLGNPHQLNQYFVKVAENDGNSEWEVYYALDGELLHGTDGNASLEDPTASSKLIKKTLSFDAAGRLVNADNPDLPPQDFNLTVSGMGGASPADPLAIEISYNGSTQFGGEFSPSFTQNGFTTGEYSSMSIASDGTIVANYTNGESQIMGALALADFNNMNGLQAVGGNAWVETGASGQPVLGQPGTNGFASVKGQAVEESNVDMSQELVNMIIAQRTYQANAQTIKTQDQILQTLITLR